MTAPGAREIAAWDAADTARVTAAVRDRFTLDAAVDNYEALDRHAISARRDNGPGDDMSDHLGWLAKEAEARTLLLTDFRFRAHGDARPRSDAAASTEVVRRVIAASGLFDSAWYCAAYPQAIQSGPDPITHCLQHGAAEGYDPSPDFDSAAHLAANPHLQGLDLCPLEHFLRQCAQFDGPDLKVGE